MSQKVFFKTFGCQMNEHDTQKMESLLSEKGYQKTLSQDDADVVVINTCSIREKAYHKAISTIGQTAKGTRSSRKKNPNRKKPIIAVTGCVVSHDGENILKKFPYVNVVAGPDQMAALPGMVDEARLHERKSLKIDFQDISDYEFPKAIEWNKTQECRVKAYVTIMKGCDNTCSFCIVPFVRGKEVSRPSDEIIDEINRLKAQGIREVMLLGQNVNSYGKHLPEKTNFAKLLRRIDEETAIERIRYTSPHPKDLSKDLVEEYARNTKLCEHIHLPLQAGSNRILKKMRRSYTREVFLRKVEQLRAVKPDVAITSDIIVGFPGETDEDFEQTLSMVREVNFDASYSFTFSPRPNTEAAGFVDDVSDEVKSSRLKKLQVVQNEISLKRYQSRIGCIEEVLVEKPSDEGQGQLMGRSSHGRLVNFFGDESLVGAMIKVRVLSATPFSLKGEVLC